MLISGPSICYGRLDACEPAALAFPVAGGAIVTLSEPSTGLVSPAGLLPSLALWPLVLEEGLVGSLLPSIDPFLLLFTSGLVGSVFPSAELSLPLLKGAFLSVASRLFRPSELFVASSEPVLVAVTASVVEGVLEDEALSFLA